MLSQYYQTKSGVEFRTLPGPNVHHQHKSGVQFRPPFEPNPSYYNMPNRPQYPAQPSVIHVKPVFGQKNTIAGRTPKKHDNRTPAKRTHKKHQHRGARKKTYKKQQRNARKERRNKKRQLKVKKLRYKTVEYKRECTGTNQLIFGTMLCWGMSAVTAWWLIMEEIKDPFLNLACVSPANAIGLFFAFMSVAFYTAGAFMHLVKRAASAYCCWIAAVVPAMLGCVCFYRWLTEDFDNTDKLIEEELTFECKYSVNELMFECKVMCAWFFYLTILYVTMGLVFYRMRSEGFTKILK